MFSVLQYHIALKAPLSHQFPQSRLGRDLCHRIPMYTGDQLTTALHSILYGTDLLLGPDLIHSQNSWGHRSDQHDHALCFWTAIQNIGAYTQIILRYSLIRACNFRAFIYHSHRNSGHIAISVADLTD